MSSAQPKDAAAVILLRPNTDPTTPEVFWVKRSTKLAFLGGYRAFPGGQRETSDAEVIVLNCEDAATPAVLSCAAREVFEVLGGLLARVSARMSAVHAATHRD